MLHLILQLRLGGDAHLGSSDQKSRDGYRCRWQDRSCHQAGASQCQHPAQRILFRLQRPDPELQQLRSSHTTMSATDLTLWKGLHEDSAPGWGDFVETTKLTVPSEATQLQYYQCPHGSHHTSLVHLLHWPSLQARLTRFASIGLNLYDNFSLQLIAQTFPGFFSENHTAIDIVSHDSHLAFIRLTCFQYCRERPSHVDGIRQTPEQLYGDDPNLENQFAYVYSFLYSLEATSDAPAIIIYGQAARRFFLN